MTTKQELQSQEKEIHNINAALEAHMKELDFKVRLAKYDLHCVVCRPLHH